MRAEFTRPDDGTEVVATARWDGHRVHIDAEDEDVRRALERVFRPTPVVVNDPAFRSLGARGESVMQPGTLEWFETVAFARAPAEGFAVRLVPEVTGQGGWDPAASYRTFRSTIRRLVESSAGRDREPRDSDAPPTVR